MREGGTPLLLDLSALQFCNQNGGNSKLVQKTKLTSRGRADGDPWLDDRHRHVPNGRVVSLDPSRTFWDRWGWFTRPSVCTEQHSNEQCSLSANQG